MLTYLRSLLLAPFFCVLVACAGSAGDGTSESYGDNGDDDGPLVAALEKGTDGYNVEAGQAFKTTANLNFRTGPSLEATIQRVLPKGTIVTADESGEGENGFLAVSGNGLHGYVFMKYLAVDHSASKETEETVEDVDGDASPEVAISRAKSAMGFSYFWGGGSWDPSGATPQNAGSCSGSCPNCSHRGKYGSDCSGLVAKAWQFGQKDIQTNSHPYGTADFAQNRPGLWKHLPSRTEARKGDAFVYRSGGAGHIVLYERGDTWGTSVVYECKGCSYGCVYNSRNLGSGFKGLRRNGF